jgi:hypothetical protein
MEGTIRQPSAFFCHAKSILDNPATSASFEKVVAFEMRDSWRSDVADSGTQRMHVYSRESGAKLAKSPTPSNGEKVT